MSEAVEIDVPALIKKLKSADEIDPYRHDGSYETVQLAGRLYYENWPTAVNHSDLDLFYYLVTIRTKWTKDKKINACSLPETAKEKLLACNERVHDLFEKNAGRKKLGMFYGPIGTFARDNSVPLEEVEPIVKMFAWLAGNPDASSEEKINLVEKTFDHHIRGFKNGTASIILHCIDPFTFPVINSNQGRDTVFSVLGVEGLPSKPAQLNDLTRYADYCRSIQGFRDNGDYSFKNYRVIDIIGFDMPAVRNNAGGVAIDPLEDIPEEEQLAALQVFLGDASCLDRVTSLLEQVNLFDVLKITTTEIRHSNVLAWLLDVCQNHGFEELFLSKFLGLIGAADGNSINDYKDFLVRNEVSIDDGGRIDILMESEKNNLVVAIENKVFTGEHDDQLSRYYGYLEEHYPEMEKSYVFLTPQGAEASDSENWQSVGYAQIAEILDSCLKEAKGTISDDARMIVEHYLEAVRKDVLGNDPVKKVAKTIYRKHRLALDAIYAHRPDEQTDVMERLSEALDENGAHTIKWDRSRVLFTTDSLPTLRQGGLYGSTAACCFELSPSRETMKLVFRYPGSDNASSDENAERKRFVENLGGDADDGSWAMEGFGPECTIGELYRSSKALAAFVQSVLSESEDLLSIH